MPHMIGTEDNLVLAQRRAWHGLGIVVPQDGIPLWEAFKMAGADWPVGKYQAHVQLADGRIVPVEDNYYTVREDTGLVLGRVSGSYEVISNRQVGAFMEKLLDPNVTAEALSLLPKKLQEATGAVGYAPPLVETIGTLDNCRRFWVLLRIPGHIDIAGMPNERVEFYLLATTTHGQSYSAGGGFEGFTIKGTGTRVVCDNTATAALFGPGAMATVRHIGDIDGQLEAARDSLGITFKFVAQYNEMAERLLDRKMTPARLDTFLSTLVPVPVHKTDDADAPPKQWRIQEERRVKNLRERIGEIIDTEEDLGPIRGTDYGAFQGVAAYERHHRRFVKTDVASADERRFSTMMGLSSNRSGLSLTTRAGKILTGQPVGQSGNALLESQLAELLHGF